MSIKNNIAQKFGFVPSKEVADLKSSVDALQSTLLSALNAQASERSFAAARTTNLTSDWNDIYDTISGSLYKGLVLLRARSRWLSENDPWAKKYLFMLQKNAVGPDGFVLRNNATELVYDQASKKSKRQYDKVANMIIQEAYDDWCLPENCGVTEQLAFTEICNINIKQIATDGEILIKLVRDTSFKYGYKLQLIEADYLDETFNVQLDNGNMVVLGVEMTSYRKPVAYWLKKVNPYNALMYGATFTHDRIRVPMYDKNGMLQIKHLFVQERSNQVRGVPWFAPIAIRSKMLSGYEEAILVDARVSANKNIIYEYKDGATGDEMNKANVAGAYFPKDANGKEDPRKLIVPSSPGSDVIVPLGMTSKIADFKSPSGREGEFQKWALRGMASGLDVSFIGLANNYEAVNYTSSRTNLLEERDTWKGLHAWLRNHFLNWNFAELLKMSLMIQAIALPLSKYQKFNKPWFQGRAWKWVSPKDEAEAILLMLSNDAWLFEEFLAENGWSLEEFIEKKKAERDAFIEADLPFPGSNYKQVKPIEATPEPVPNNNGKAHNVPVEEY